MDKVIISKGYNSLTRECSSELDTPPVSQIIDGVDVSGCEFATNTIPVDCDNNTCFCYEDKDCDYKQLKRLQAENERLKKECILYDCGNKEWSIEYHKLQDEYTELLDRLDDVTYDKSQYKQALQEIRDVVSEHIVCDDCKLKGTDKCDERMCTHFYLNDFSKDIIDKINSVIGAE